MLTWKRAEILMILVATAVLATITVTFYSNWAALRQDRELEVKSRSLLQGVNGLVSSIFYAEICRRDYLLTRNSHYLTPSATISAEAARVRKMLPADPDSDRFLALVNSKIADLSNTIDFRSPSSFETALAIVTADQGRSDMAHLLSASQNITSKLSRSLAASTERRRERSRLLGFVNIGGGVILLGLLLVAAVMIQRSAHRREQLIALLQEDELRLREANKHAQDAEARVRDTLESISDAFVCIQPNFDICYVNHAAEQIFGRLNHDLLNKNFFAEFPEESTPQLQASFRQVMETRLPLSFEMFLPTRNAWWEQSIYPAKDGGLSLYFRDVTERKRLDERSRHAQKLESLGVLAGGIAHDFNNLLTAILGGASLLQEELPQNSLAAAHLQLIVNAGERAAQLTRQMLAYSGRGRFVVEPIDLSRQIREIAQLLQSSLSKDVELILRLDDSPVFIDADPGQIQQLVMNLVVNAAEAIETGPGTVIVSTRVDDLDAQYIQDNMVGDNVVPGRFVLLEIHDTGKGMNEATLAKIFDPFFTTKFTGRGLGLAAVIGIVRGHHGAIKAVSHPGQGTTFKVCFPIAREQAQIAVASASHDTLHGDETILVVDDEEPVQRLARVSLERYGYSVLQARNGREAIEIFRSRHETISLVLLDMTMPVLSGDETLQQLQLIHPQVRVIASSGYNEIEALRRFGHGVLGFLQKPYRAVTLAGKIRDALSARRSAVT